jgi:hypothetical protein
VLIPPRILPFDGPVQCLAQPRAGDWRLRGRLRSEAAGDSSRPAELLLSGVRAATPTQPLPRCLHDLRLQVVVGPEGDRDEAAMTLSLAAREGSFTLEVEALRVHYDVSQSFYPALPRVVLPLLTRAAWAALLTLLRVPLLSRLLNRPAQTDPTGSA